MFILIWLFFNHALSVPRDQAYSLNLDCIEEVFPRSSLQHRLLGCRKCVGCVVLVDTGSRIVFFVEQLRKRSHQELRRWKAEVNSHNGIF